LEAISDPIVDFWLLLVFLILVSLAIWLTLSNMVSFLKLILFLEHNTFGCVTIIVKFGIASPPVITVS